MVTRVYGTSDGVEIIFTPSEDGLWKCVVPVSQDGQYIVDLYAEDEAGNTSYFATVLFTVDAKHLRVEMKWLNRFEDKLEVINFLSIWNMRRFNMEVVKCEVCGRW